MKTNTLSIISLVTAILGLALVPVVLGHVALGQIKRTGEAGTPLAVIGLVLGYLEIVALIVLVVLWVIVANSGQLQIV